LSSCYAGNLFDGLDSTLFTAVFPVAISELLHQSNPILVSQVTSWIAAFFLLGWSAGGVLFGYIADKCGRVKALCLSIVVYGIFTGLCGLAENWQTLALFRLITALGIGGELVVGNTLLVESFSGDSRAKALGFLTTAYQAGVCLVGLLNLLPFFAAHWRFLFLLGTLPSLLILFIRRCVPESQSWQTSLLQQNLTSETQNPIFPWKRLVQQEYRKRFAVASLIASALMVTYWASSFWISGWIHVLRSSSFHQADVGFVLLLQGCFAILGALLVGVLANGLGRRHAIIWTYLGYLVSSLCFFLLNQQLDVFFYFQAALMGLFMGLSIGSCNLYVLELFPSSIRATATGTSFTIGKLCAVIGVLYSAKLIQLFQGSYATAAAVISFALIPGILAAVFGPETMQIGEAASFSNLEQQLENR
jgi:MFS family permease